MKLTPKPYLAGYIGYTVVWMFEADLHFAGDKKLRVKRPGQRCVLG